MSLASCILLSYYVLGFGMYILIRLTETHKAPVKSIELCRIFNHKDIDKGSGEHSDIPRIF